MKAADALYNMALAQLAKEADDGSGRAPWLQHLTDYGAPIAGGLMGLPGGVPGVMAGAGLGHLWAQSYKPQAQASTAVPATKPADPVHQIQSQAEPITKALSPNYDRGPTPSVGGGNQGVFQP